MVYFDGDDNIFLDFDATRKRLMELIKSSDLEVKEIARRLNIAKQTVYQWRNGENFPEIENLFALTRLLGVTIEDVVLSRAEEFSCKLKNSRRF